MFIVSGLFLMSSMFSMLSVRFMSTGLSVKTSKRCFSIIEYLFVKVAAQYSSEASKMNKSGFNNKYKPGTFLNINLLLIGCSLLILHQNSLFSIRG